MIFTYKRGEFSIPWIWSEVLHPTDRFMSEDKGDGFARCCVLSDEVLRVRIHQALIRETVYESIATDVNEWPSEHWDRVSDYVSDPFEDHPENEIRSETPIAPVYAYLNS